MSVTYIPTELLLEVLSDLIKLEKYHLQGVGNANVSG